MTTNECTKVSKATSAIYDLDTEADLETAFQAYKARVRELRDRKNASTVADLAVGDKVRFIPATRPKHLAGKVATVTALPRAGAKKVHYQVDADQATPMAGAPIVGPASHVEKV